MSGTLARVALAICALVAMRTTAAAQDLRQAIFDGDLAAVRAALQKKSPVNAKDTTGWTALMNAATYAKGPRVDIVRALLDAGASLESINDQGDTALIAATRYAHHNIDVVRLLLERGANVNARRRDGRTAIIGAAFNLDVDEVIALIEKGADVNAADAAGDTPLLMAMGEAGVPPDASDMFPQNREAQILRTIEPLLTHGANPSAKNKKGETPLSHVVRWEQMTNHNLPAIGRRLRQAGAK